MTGPIARRLLAIELPLWWNKYDARYRMTETWKNTHVCKYVRMCAGVCVCLHAHVCRGAYILSTQSGEIQFSYIFMPRTGIKYTHRSDKSWETFLAFCFGQRSWTKGARHARLSIQIGGRILPLKIFIGDPFPPLFSSGPRMRATFFLLFCFAQRAERGSDLPTRSPR